MILDSKKEKCHKSKDFEKVRQNIFASKTEKERKMWELILKRLQSESGKPR